MRQKRLCDCLADEIIRFGDGSGFEHLILSIGNGSAVIEIINDLRGADTQQTIPVDDETLVWARPRYAT